MKNTPQKTKPALAPLTSILGRYHLTIFIVILVGGLVTAVLLLNGILQQASDTTGYTSSLDIAPFDQATIDRVAELRASTEAPTAFTLPAGRTNPFAE